MVVGIFRCAVSAGAVSQVARGGFRPSRGNGVRRSVRVGRYETGYRDLHGAGPHAARPVKVSNRARRRKLRGESSRTGLPIRERDGREQLWRAAATGFESLPGGCPSAGRGGPSFARPDGTGIETQQEEIDKAAARKSARMRSRWQARAVICAVVPEPR